MKPTFDRVIIISGVRIKRDAAGQRHVAVPGAQALAGEVHGDERRRAGGVDRDARAAQVEQVRQAVGEDAVHGPGERPGIDGVAIGELQHRVVVVVAGDEDTGRRTGELLARQAGMVERVDGDLEEQAVLRVDALRLPLA